MWRFKSIRGEEVIWYSEEEYNKLKEENDMLKKLLEGHKVFLENPVDVSLKSVNEDLDWNGEEE